MSNGITAKALVEAVVFAAASAGGMMFVMSLRDPSSWARLMVEEARDRIIHEYRSELERIRFRNAVRRTIDNLEGVS